MTSSVLPRILLITSPDDELPPRGYGGTQRIVWWLWQGLLKRGYDVTLMGGRQTPRDAKVVRYRQGAAGQARIKRLLLKFRFYQKLQSMLTKVDLVHSHHRPDYLIPALKNSRTVLSYHGVLDPSQVEQPYRMSKGRVHFAGISNSQISGVRNIGHWTVVHHGIDQSLYKPILHRPNPGYLVFLGRIWRPKGLHTAIEVAKATDSNLIIAGNIVQIRDNDNLFYYEHEILPQIDGKQIQYVGEVSDAEKDGLFKDARALLMPIEWEEPFGLAMVEAMACGTPVIAFNRGSAPEIVTNGQDGIICSSLQGMIEAVQHVTEIDRAVCRRTVETRFSVNAMLDRYEALYRGVVGAPA